MFHPIHKLAKAATCLLGSVLLGIFLTGWSVDVLVIGQKDKIDG